MTSPHLTDEQIACALSEPSDAAASAHVDACAECRAALRRLKDGVGAYARAVGDAAPSDDGFWTRQRAEIAGRAAGRERRRWAVWGAGLAAAVSIVLWLAVGRAERAVVPPADDDHELLLSVERSLHRGMPAALEPAQLLVADVGATSAAR
jgi:hypothetical protein